MEDKNLNQNENLPKNAKKENPTPTELADRLLKREAMAKYRARLKNGEVDGPVNKLGKKVLQVNTQLDTEIIKDFREKLEILNEENKTNFTTAEMIANILHKILPALEIKESNGVKEFYINDHIIQYKNIEQYMPPKETTTKTKKLKI